MAKRLVLKSGCTRAKFHKRDGLLVLTVSRLTKNDGKTSDPFLKMIRRRHLWLRDLAPPGKIVGEWYRSKQTNQDWAKFSLAYTDYLHTLQGQAAMEDLYARLKKRHRATVLCVECTPEHCHRKILLEEMFIKFPGIEIEIH